MAKVFPSLEQIRKFTPAPEPGELVLMEFLARELDDTYEVFFQPMMDGDRPDVVILREGRGVAIIEVKDWDLRSYDFTKECLCRVKSSGALMESPIKQVHRYKEHLINLYIPDLCAEIAVNRQLFAVVSTAVYFHRALESDLSTFFPSQHTKWTQLIGLDSLNLQRASEVLKALHLDRESVLFNADLYRRFRTFLAPPTHTLDQGHDLIYTPEQRQLAVSKAEGKKIAGVAGAGKTYVLAKRAVNAYVRTRRPVLVLTFNITLKNYIHDRISEVREAFDWANFCITNYHCFFATQANRYELPYTFGNDDEDHSSFSNEEFFEPVAGKINKFSAIFIDEVQDYKIEWLRIVRKYFLAGGGEYVLFGDEKQNLYGRPLESKAIRTNIPGPFARMKTSQRLNTRLAELATKFQVEFFGPRHEVDVIQSVRQQGLFEPRVEYRCCSGVDSQQLMQIIMSYLNRWGVHPNDASILCSRNEDVRRLDFVVRVAWRQRTTICCETQEEFDTITHKSSDGPPSLDLRNIRRSRRYNFWANAGKMKLCTVHSFKGWECSTIFLIIDEQRFDDNVNDELIYTALTRCRDNVVVISLGKNRYHDFFAREVGVFAS